LNDVRSTAKEMKIPEDLNTDERKCDVNTIVNVMRTLVKNQTKLLSLVENGPRQTNYFNRSGSVECGLI